MAYKPKSLAHRVCVTCALEGLIFVGGAIALAVSQVIVNTGGNMFIAGFATGVSGCALLYSVSSAIPKIKFEAGR